MKFAAFQTVDQTLSRATSRVAGVAIAAAVLSPPLLLPSAAFSTASPESASPLEDVPLVYLEEAEGLSNKENTLKQKKRFKFEALEQPPEQMELEQMELEQTAQDPATAEPLAEPPQAAE